MALMLPTLLALALIVSFIVRRVHLALFSPLAKIPNAHPLAPWTGTWMLWLRYQQTVNENVFAAHADRGPLVRVGPNELSVNCIDDGVKAIYSNRTFLKHRLYSQFFNFGVPPMFATIDSNDHATKRKRVSNVFSKTYLQNSTNLHAIIREILFQRLLPQMDDAATSESEFDLIQMMQAVVSDTATSYNWGLGNGTRYLLDKEGHADFLEVYFASRPESMFFVPVEFTTVTRWLSKISWSPLPKDCFYSNDTVDAWCLDLCDKAEATLASDQPLSPGYHPVVYAQLRDALTKENVSSIPSSTGYRTSPLSFKRHRTLSPDMEKILTKIRSPRQIEIAAELLDETVATNDVLANTLIYICWELSRHLDIQKQLRDELMTLSPDMIFNQETDGTLPSAKDLDKLPLLHAVVMETLRHWPVNPGMEPRLTPANATLAGYTGIPAGVRVSAMPYALHRNPEVYPDPWSWIPQRWLPSIEERGKWAGNGEADRWFWAFSSGLRMCLGNNLSMHLMKFIIASIYINFETIIVADKGMTEQTKGFIAAPLAEKLVMRVKRWD